MFGGGEQTSSREPPLHHPSLSSPSPSVIASRVPSCKQVVSRVTDRERDRILWRFKNRGSFSLGGISLFLSGCLSGGRGGTAVAVMLASFASLPPTPEGFPCPFFQSSGRSLFHLQTLGWPVWGLGDLVDRHQLLLFRFEGWAERGNDNLPSLCRSREGLFRSYLFLLGETWRQAHTSYIVSSRW